LGISLQNEWVRQQAPNFRAFDCPRNLPFGLS
jgi:hypothetical protein